jgi:hypothetical protein
MAGGAEYLIENNNDDMVKKARDFIFENYIDKRLIENMAKLYISLV